MESDVDDTPVNLGNPSEFTIKELAERFKHCIDMILKSSTTTYHPTIKRRKPDISLHRAVWLTPRVPLHHGLKALTTILKSC